MDASLARELVARQFPQWGGLALQALPGSGTDHDLFRLGESWLLRFPRRPEAALQVVKEQRWLPALAALPLEVPRIVGAGAASEAFPWPWTVQGWIEGVPATHGLGADRRAFACALADFVVALHGLDSSAGPGPGEHNAFRGEPLARRDAETRACLRQLEGAFDVAALTAAWERALEAAPWTAPGVWIHGDLQPGNLLLRDGRLHAVIDFGLLGVGDPACDLLAAWSCLDAQGRAAFRSRLDVDDATWERGRGWAITFGAVAWPYYRETNPVLAGLARRALLAAARGPQE